MGRSPRRRRRWAGTTCSTPTISMARSRWPRAFRQPGWAAPSRSAPWWSGRALLEQVFRDEWGRVLASLMGFLGDFVLAEEASQKAFAIAAARWPPRAHPPIP